MKKYETPELQLISTVNEDIITASPGVIGPVVEENGGMWDLDIS